MAAGPGHLAGTNAVTIPKMRPDYWSNCQIALHTLLIHRVTQTGAPNQVFSRCQRHGCEEFEAISSVSNDTLTAKKHSEFGVARTFGQILYVSLSTERLKMTFAAAIIHFGTFYQGMKRVGK